MASQRNNTIFNLLVGLIMLYFSQRVIKKNIGFLMTVQTQRLKN